MADQLVFGDLRRETETVCCCIAPLLLHFILSAFSVSLPLILTDRFCNVGLFVSVYWFKTSSLVCCQCSESLTSLHSGTYKHTFNSLYHCGIRFHFHDTQITIRLILCWAQTLFFLLCFYHISVFPKFVCSYFAHF